MSQQAGPEAGGTGGGTDGPHEGEELESEMENSVADIPLTDDELLLASPILYGSSLSDKIFLEFNVENVSPIEWNDDAFAGLIVPSGRKDFLRSLVEAHDAGSSFDDFMRDHSLNKIFGVAVDWNVIVLIDETSSWRSVPFMILRNAMVAVFLRHIEYYRGILFLTTNRITTFDEGFLSRIHVALHFDGLPHEAKQAIWRAFLRKFGVIDEIPPELVRSFANRNVNGR
ncbi:hypothetical protein C8Q79DRAFT_1006054 [Trametes meyenii]|nr:hypothetical protein C8Q79DRAFT_1006054 [Trametes meyenii]